MRDASVGMLACAARMSSENSQARESDGESNKTGHGEDEHIGIKRM
jgi:hypothetical protein